MSGCPHQVILACLVVTALAAGGWIQFRWGAYRVSANILHIILCFFRLEHKANRLWIPMDSTFNLQKVNLEEVFHDI